MKSKVKKRNKLESLVTKNDGTSRSKEEIMKLIETQKKEKGRPDLINLINTARC